MTTIDQAPFLLQSGHVVSSDGEKIGKVGEVYVDDATGRLSWVTVKTGLFGTRESFVPMDEASISDDTITVPYEKAMIRDAPHAEPGEPLSVEQEDELYSYYNVGVTTQAATHTTTHAAGEGTGAVAGAAAAGGAALKAGTKSSNADGYLTLSEEQLRVGTQRVEAGRARMRKFVVTEQQTVTVPVSHDEVRIVREALQPGEFAGEATIGEDVIEVALMQDKVLVDKQVVGVEKVKLATQTVTEQRQVTDAVRKEHIEVTGDALDATTKTSTTRTSTTRR
jgi:uncharacterized protein (TIGR02271 family)